MTITCWYPGCPNAAPHADDRALAIHFIASHVGNIREATAEPEWLQPLLVHDIKLVNEHLREDVTRDVELDLRAWRERMVDAGWLTCPTCDGRGWHTAGAIDGIACGRCPAGEAWGRSSE